MRAASLTVLLLLPLAHASPASPPLSDARADCAVPYGNLYLDVTAAWIENETPDAFDVALEIAGFDERLADGAGYAVQFEHQGVRWGVVAWYSPAAAALAGGPEWNFLTGRATASEVDAAGFRPTTGSFSPGSPALLRASFPKSIFPHGDANDTQLRSFWAASVDLRPAFPFILSGQDASGKWILCDEAEGTGAYAFQHGAHSHEAPAPVAAAPDPAPSPAAPPEPRLTPGVPLAGVLAILVAAARGLRTKP